MPTIEFEGKTTEEAIEKACSQLHLAKDELNFEILSTGTSGIFGLLSGKKARIKVTIEEKLSAPPGTRAPKAAPEKPEAPPFSSAPATDTTARTPRPGPKKEKRAPEHRTEPIPGPRPQPDISALTSPTVPGPGEEVYQGPEEEAMTHAREVLEGILERMPLDASVAVSRINDRIILNIQGDNSGLLIGKKGVTLDAFQFLVNKIVNRSQAERCHVIVDTGDYRTRRHDALINLAHRMADKARSTRRPVSISALSAQERRIVHLTLKNESGLTTRSKGEGNYKKIMIFPDRAPQDRQPVGDFEAQAPSMPDTESALAQEELTDLETNHGSEELESQAPKE
ncbi:MAG: Jag N-terminal domain-containing protein [Deltaproteobacteria bacterium]|nr:Jag N-terminal domain-containing protein [Deltaproteobacteria bacterium]